MPQRELVKLIVRAVVLERDGDKVTGELVTEPVSCFDLAQVEGLLAQAQVDVDAWNAAQPNRAQRRRKA